MNNAHRFVIAVLALLAAAAVAYMIWDEVGPAAPPDTTRYPAALDAGWHDRAPKRLAVELFRAAQDRPQNERELALDAAWVTAPANAGARMEDGRLLIPEGKEPPALSIPVDVEAAAYSELALTMSLEAGSKIEASWESSHQPSLEGEANAVTPAFPNGETLTYVLPLRDAESRRWRGRVSRLAVQLADAPSRVEITSVTLRYRPPAEPLYVDIRGEAHEALPQDTLEWQVEVPEHGVFSVYCGLDESAWEAAGTNGVGFTASVVTEAQSQRLFNMELRPGQEEGDRFWTREVSDLRAWAGQTVTLRMSMDPLGDAAGDFAYWGSPMVYEQPPQGEGPPHCPVILISCDTLRADHVSAYGYHRLTTPHLDAFAREAVVFENAISEWPVTLNAHAIMMTGEYGEKNGITAATPISPNVMTLASRLRDAGYLNGGFTGFRWWLMGSRGYQRGFDHYDTGPDTYRPINETLELVDRWLGHAGHRPFFLFFHNYDIHSKFDEGGRHLPYHPEDMSYIHFAEPYQPLPSFSRPNLDARATQFLIAGQKGEFEFTGHEVDSIVALYDDSIRMVDDYLARHFDFLRKRGLYDQSLIIVTSDHGEAFGEFGEWLHGHIYDPIAHVPLIIKFPYGRYAGQRILKQTQLADLFATVLEVTGLDQDPDRHSRSLVDVITGDSRGRDEVFLRRYGFRGVRTPELKLITELEKDDPRLYRVKSGELEQPLPAEQYPEALKRLNESVRAHSRIEETGWHIAMRGQGERLELNMTLSGLGAFSEPQIPYFDRDTPITFEASQNGRVLSIMMMTPAGGFDELRTAVDPPDAVVSFALEANRPFRLLAGKQSADAVTRETLILHPMDAPLERPSLEAMQGELPTVAIWYVPGEAELDDLDDMPAEAREALEALGYGPAE